MLTDDIKNKILNASHDFFVKKSIAIKFLFIFLAVLITLIFARIGVLGSSIQEISKRAFNVNIPVIDEKRIDLSIASSFSVFDTNTKTYIIGKLDGYYLSGSQIKVSFDINSPAWILVVGLDSTGEAYTISSNEPLFYKNGKDYTFTLDENIGKEVFYIFASTRKFSYLEEIKERIKQPSLNSKGIVQKYSIDIPNDIVYDYIYFNHI